MIAGLTNWRKHAEALARKLAAQGVITDAAWLETVKRVPRHIFVPAFYDDDPPTLIDSDDPRWLAMAYADDTLVTQYREHPDHPGQLWATSSSTRPSLMLFMLHTLDVHEGMTVLEVGTGTGYNVALLSERLGAANVTSIDIDPELIEAAHARLGEAGYEPTVAVGDANAGYPGRSPYDRLIATVGLERVPYTWVEQTLAGGVILADVRPRGMTWAGALARLTVSADGTASGPLVPCTWGFMSTRPDVIRPGTPEMVPIDARTVRTRPSEIGSDALRTPGLSLLIWHRLPGINAFPDAGGTRITTPDGSWAEITRTTSARVDYGGPADIWAQAEQAHHWWIEHGRPGVEAFGLTVTPDRQDLWYAGRGNPAAIDA